jgi:hypothetical protein
MNNTMLRGIEYVESNSSNFEVNKASEFYKLSI